MIEIRYADLPAGQRVRAEARGGRIVIYLRPGLSRAQRRGALRKVRRPAGSVFLTALLASVVVCYVLFVSVSIQLIPAPPDHGALPVLHGSKNGSDLDQRHRVAETPVGQQVIGPVASSTAGASASPSASAATVAPSQLAATPVPLPIASPGPSASPSPGPTAGASPSPSPPSGDVGDPGGLCLDAGEFGSCVSVPA